MTIEFDRDKLSRATRPVGPEDPATAAAGELIDALVSALAEWKSSSDSPIRATANQIHDEDRRLHELTFTQGARQLVLVHTEDLAYLVENLGRTDTPAVSSTP